MYDPIRASNLKRLDQLDPENTIKKIKGRDHDLLSPNTSPQNTLSSTSFRPLPMAGTSASQMGMRNNPTVLKGVCMYTSVLCVCVCVREYVCVCEGERV